MILFALCVFGAGSVAAAQTIHFGSFESTVVPSGLKTPHNVAVDASGNVYIPDTWNHRVLKEAPSGGSYTQSTLGTGWQEPFGITIDAVGNLYVTDTGLNTLVKLAVNGSGYTQSTIGSGFNSPQGLAVDASGNLYVTDTMNNQLVKETLSGGVYTASPLVTGLNEPSGVAVDAGGNLYIADTDNYRVLIETLSAGSYIQSQMNVPGLDMPFGIAVDPYGNVYVVDTYHNKILRETLSSGGTYTQTAIPTSQMYYPGGVAVDRNGNVYIADSDNARVIEETVTGVNFGAVNVGSQSSALTLNFVIDTAGTLGPVVVKTAGVVGLDFNSTGKGTCTTGTAYAAAATCTVGVTFTPLASGMRRGAVVLENSSGNVLATGYVFGVGVGPQANFLPGVQRTVLATGLNGPFGVAADFSGNVYLADAHNYRVLKETPSGSGYSATTVVGGNQYGPYGLALDGAGNVYVADYNNSRIVKVSPVGSTWVQTTIVSGLKNPYGVAVDVTGNVYIADTNNQRIVKESLTPGGYMQSVVPTSSLDDPYGVAVDGSGNVYLVDTWHNRALKETLTPTGYTETTIGSGLAGPGAIAVDGNGNVFIADTYNKQIVKETPSGAGYAQSTVVSGNLSLPLGVAVDGNGNLYVGDYAGNQVLMQDVADLPSLSFATTNVGSTSSDSPKTVVLENIGNATLNFPAPSSGNNPSIAANFVLAGGSSSDCSVVSAGSSTTASLSAGASCLLPVSFEPTASGTISGSLVVTDNALNAAAPGYATQSIALSGTANSVVPVIAWPAPAAISYGTALSGTQLNATSTVAGTFAYTPALGTVLTAGSQTLSVTFTPTDTVDYSKASAAVTLVVNRATPAITWATPASISYGTALSTGQLNATATIAGSFLYSPAVGAVLGAGPQTLSVTFTPTDSTDYTTATSTVTLNVSQAAQTITFAPVISPVTYGAGPMALSATGGSSGLPVTFSVTGPATLNGSTLTITGAGTVVVTASQAGNANYAVAASVQQTLVVNRATPAITWVAPASISYGTALSGTQLNATSTVAGSFLYSPAVGAVLGAGPQTLSVTFTPTDSTDYTTATSTVTLNVSQAAQTITFAPVISPVTYGAGPMALSATGGSSGLPVTFSVTGPATVNGSTLTITGAGTVVVTASQAGNTNYCAPKSVSQTVVVNQAASATALMAASQAPMQQQADLLTATVTGPGVLSGTVGFSAGGATICSAALNNGTATCSYAPQMAGSSAVTAQYLGDTNHTASSASLTLNVQPLYDAAINLQAANTQLVYPGATNLSICVTSSAKAAATGTVGITDGATPLTTLTLGGDGCAYWYITPGLAAGTHAITASYSGDKKNAAGSSAPVAITVSPIPVALALSCWNPTFVYGNNFQCAVTASSNAGAPQGSIAYSVDGGSSASLALSYGSATVAIPAPAAGSHQLTVSWAQQTNYAASAALRQAFTVTVAPVVVTLSSSTASAPPGTSVSFAAAVTSTSAGAPAGAGSIAFMDGSTPLATVALNAQGQASFVTAGLAPGTHNISAVYSGSSNYGTGTASASVTIAQSSSTTTLTASSTTIGLGQTAQLAAAVTGLNPTGVVVFTARGATLCTSSLSHGTALCGFTPSVIGALTVVAKYQGDANNLGSAGVISVSITGPVDLAVSQQFTSTTLTYPGATNVTTCVSSGRKAPATGTIVVQDGSTPLITQTLGGDGCAYWYISPALAVGTHVFTATYSGDKNNLAGTSAATTITVNPVPVTLAVALNNASIPYGISARMTVTASSSAGPPLGSIGWALDRGAVNTLGLSGGNAQIAVPAAAAGQHTVVVSYAQQTNYAAAAPQTIAFTVTPAPTTVTLTKSATSVKVGASVTFTAAVMSGTAGAPSSVGSVAFYDGSNLLGTVAVNALGQAIYSTSALTAGTHTITATYTGANYATASGVTTIYIMK